MERQTFTVRKRLTAFRWEDPDLSIVISIGERLICEEPALDPVVFGFGNHSFTVDRTTFLESVI